MGSMRCLGCGFVLVLAACSGNAAHEDLSEDDSSTTADEEAAEPQPNDDGASAEAADGADASVAPVAEPVHPEEYDAGASEPVLPLQVPEGLAIHVFATDTGDARSLTEHEGAIYASLSQEGKIVRLVDGDGDGVAEQRSEVVDCFEGVHGLVFHEDSAFFATPSSLYRAHVDAQGNFDEPVAIFKDLPSGGPRPTHALATDGAQLYVSTGSSCEACIEQNPERATIVRAMPDGSARSVFARGLRNPLAFALEPEQQRVWALDTQGVAGQTRRTLELNLIEAEHDYGWPYCFGDRRIASDMAAPAAESAEAYCARSALPALVTEVEAEPFALAFARSGALPMPYADGAFVTLRGLRQEQVASKLLFIAFESGVPVSVRDFATASNGVGTPSGAPVSLSGLTVAKDGTVLVADDVNGLIYRIYAP